MSSEFIVGALGFILALVLFYVPSASSGWANLSGDVKRLVLLGACALIAAVAYALPCIGVDAGAGVACPAGANWPQFAYDFIALVLAAAGAAQVAYLGAQIVTPRP